MVCINRAFDRMIPNIAAHDRMQHMVFNWLSFHGTRRQCRNPKQCALAVGGDIRGLFGSERHDSLVVRRNGY